MNLPVKLGLYMLTQYLWGTYTHTLVHGEAENASLQRDSETEGS